MRNLSFILVILFFVSFVSALDMSAKLDSNVIVRDYENSLNFTLKIENATNGIYNLYTLSDISISPSSIFNITEPYTEKIFTIKPTENLNVKGYYTFTYTLNYRDFEKIDKKMTVNLVDLEDIIKIWSESISIEDETIVFYVENKENVNLTEISAKFSSILFETEELFDLGPFEIKTFVVGADLKKIKETKAGVYVIESIFNTKNGEKKIKGNLYLGEKKEISTTKDVAGFLIKSESITKINTGNILENIEIKINRNIFSRFFTSFNMEPTIINREGFFIEYIWFKEKLGPTEIFNVKAKTNYILPFFIILSLIFILLGLKRFSETHIEVKKSVSPVKTKNGEFALKIKILLKALRPVENVTIIDKVPAIVKIYRKFGLTKPDKIDPENRRIHWNIGDLDQGEERIFTYIVYSKVGVVGKFSLPETIAVFEREGKLHETSSNKVFFMSDQIKGN